MRKFKEKLKKLTVRKMPGQIKEKIKRVNSVVRGWINYFALGSMKTEMTRIDEHLRTRLRVIIWKQWKVPKKRRWGLLKLGIEENEARRTSNWGDHYQFVALKSCLKRAVTKEVFAKAGLVSCADYYKERHDLKLC